MRVGVCVGLFLSEFLYDRIQSCVVIDAYG